MGKSEEVDEENPPHNIGITPAGHEASHESGPNEKYGTIRDIIEADLYDARYEQTKRGLSNRQVQMMYVIAHHVRTVLMIAELLEAPLELASS